MQDEIQIEPLTQQGLFAARDAVLDAHLSPQLEEYLLQLVLATRNLGAYGNDRALARVWCKSARVHSAGSLCPRACLAGRS